MIPALIRRFHEAKINEQDAVTIWGTGDPIREFIYVDDLADACIFLMRNYNCSEILNIGNGEEISIKELAYLIKDVVGYNGEIIFDKSKPDGVPRKVLDSSIIKNMGWKANITLQDGIKQTYDWYKNLAEKNITCE